MSVNAIANRALDKDFIKDKKLMITAHRTSAIYREHMRVMEMKLYTVSN